MLNVSHFSMVDSKLTPYKVSTTSDVLSLSMLQNIPKGKILYPVSMY